jgi:hypothetical protein
MKIGGVLAETSAVIESALGEVEYRAMGLDARYVPVPGDDGLLSYSRERGGLRGQIVTRASLRPQAIEDSETTQDGIPFLECVVNLAQIMGRVPVLAEQGVAYVPLTFGDERVEVVYRGNWEKTAGGELSVIRHTPDGQHQVMVFGVKKSREDGELKCWIQSAKSLAKGGTVFGSLSEAKRSEMVEVIAGLPEAIGTSIEAGGEVTLKVFGESLSMEGGESLEELALALRQLEPNELGQRGVGFSTEDGRVIGATFEDGEEGARTMTLFNKTEDGSLEAKLLSFEVGPNLELYSACSQARGGGAEDRYLETEEVAQLVVRIPQMVQTVEQFMAWRQQNG